MPEYLLLNQRRRARRRGRALGLSVLAIVALLVVVAVVQYERGTPTATASVVLSRELVIPGQTASLPWLKRADTAVTIDGVGSLGGVRDNDVRQLASLTKLVTALVVLEGHPLKPGQSGPSITITAADVAAYDRDLAKDDSVLKVTAGERLSELQALQGALIASADNIAVILADWADGTSAKFVAAMNAETSRLGLGQLHFADPAGVNPKSVGSATDMVDVGEAVMANPVLRQIVAMPQVTLPDAGTVYNYDDVLGRDGIVGIKTGSTTNAGGNFVFAAERRVDKQPVTIVGAILGATGADALQNALNSGARLSGAAAADVKQVVVLPAGTRVLTVSSGWAPTVAGRTTRAATILAIPGEKLAVHVVSAPSLRGSRLHELRAGEQIATVDLQSGQATWKVPVVAQQSLPSASISYRLTRL